MAAFREESLGFQNQNVLTVRYAGQMARGCIPLHFHHIVASNIKLERLTVLFHIRVSLSWVLGSEAGFLTEVSRCFPHILQ